nr:endoplasmic reticulum-golgi intermediate compartment protein 2 [Quercus suber]
MRSSLSDDINAVRHHASRALLAMVYMIYLTLVSSSNDQIGSSYKCTFFPVDGRNIRYLMEKMLPYIASPNAGAGESTIVDSTHAAVHHHAATMNGYAERPTLDEDAFGENKAAKVVQAFDYFPKTKPSYQEQTSNGGVWTIILLCASLWLASTELGRWWKGNTTHTFSVEQGVGHDLQINVDVVVAMKCDDLHVNVQDASMDRILAGVTLHKDPTLWAHWTVDRKQHTLGASKKERLDAGEEYQEEDVHDYLGAAKRSKKFPRTPRVPRRTTPDSCRVYGNMHGNKVQGDFHITARGHAYPGAPMSGHLAHSSFNFSHHVNEFSFGPFYPSLTNPLDNTVATTDNNFQKFQYYLSLVPTVYTTDANALRKIDKYHESPSSGSDGLSQHSLQYSSNAVFTNQYAVTEQSHPVSEHSFPGIFVKYDIEPIMLMIAEEWLSWPALFIRLVNVISGVLVAGGWLFQITEWASEMYGRRSSRRSIGGVLTPMFGSDEKKDAGPGNYGANYGNSEKRW